MRCLGSEPQQLGLIAVSLSKEAVWRSSVAGDYNKGHRDRGEEGRRGGVVGTGNQCLCSLGKTGLSDLNFHHHTTTALAVVPARTKTQF